jgi:hypothetical protein
VTYPRDLSAFLRRASGSMLDNIAIAKSFFRYGKPDNPPCPPLKKGKNYKELLLKSPFLKGDLGGFENLQQKGIYGKRYMRNDPDAMPD